MEKTSEAILKTVHVTCTFPLKCIPYMLLIHTSRLDGFWLGCYTLQRIHWVLGSPPISDISHIRHTRKHTHSTAACNPLNGVSCLHERFISC